jgi:DNA-binding beta-propeller fold protein YncE
MQIWVLTHPMVKAINTNFYKRRNMRSLILVLLGVGLFFLPKYLSAQDDQIFVPDKKISVPGNEGYDYIAIDTLSRRLYVSHSTSLVVIDLKTEQIVGSVEHLIGMHGVAIAPEFQKGFISDGKGNAVVVFDLQTLLVVKTIPITGKDPDAIMYDPFSKQVFTFNGDSQNATVIDAASLIETGSVALGGTPEFAVSDGNGKIYNNLEDKSLLNVIDAKMRVVINSFPLAPCVGPTGLAIDKLHQRLFTVCRKNKGMTVIDISTGKAVTTVPIGSGVDAVTYDAQTSLIICSNGDGTATIVHHDEADKYSVVQTLTTAWKAKTHAFDPKTKKLYFSGFEMEPGTKNRIPDSFKVLVYKMKS